EVVPLDGSPDHAPAGPHQGEAVLVPRVPQGIQPEGEPQEALLGLASQTQAQFTNSYLDKSQLGPPTEKNRQHSCPFCQKCFPRKWHLENHVRTHTDVRQFVCRLCGKTFSVKGNLKAHLVTHVGVGSQLMM
ncbi:zinc finger protein SNAI3-like, partial [Dreissena polymorpha]|uniref:zinc finger protein SNAI3-like n=1 Tax=Dreissena polymorpha TaxID=45954 RepID=UPI00226503D7